MAFLNIVKYALCKPLLPLMLALFLIGCGSTTSDTGDGGVEAQEDSSPAGDPVPGSSEPIACDEGDAGVAGNTYYLDPVSGSNDNDGSAGSPWGSLQSVVEAGMIETRAYAGLPYDGTNNLAAKNPGAPVKAGDSLVLLDGFHGEFYLRGAYNEYPITICAALGQRPMLSRVFISAAANWHFRGLTVSPSTAATYETRTLVQIESHGWHGPASHILVEDCDLYSVANTSAWGADDWNTLACSAISASGDCMTIRGNYCKNVNFGISLSGNSGVVSGNTVENFSGDGMRGLGNDLVFEYNLVKNCYAVNANHDDAFQSWSINDDPPRERVVLRGNTFINYEDPNQPFRGALQGIGCFDGFYVDWVVENNLVITDHWHGISLYGAVNCRIVNNTVVDRNDESPGPPWIRVNPHKDGTPSEGCLIRNNIVSSVIATGDTVADHNHLLTAGDDLFVDPGYFDFHLRADATAVIDVGSSDLAPSEDLDGIVRPQGAGIDLGCYER